jgi:transcriptional regulator with XRE-family HTH domain
MYGTFIREARTSRGLTQVDLARITGIEQPNLSAYENDRQMPSADVLNRIMVGCGYILEATAGERRLMCPLPGSRRTTIPDPRFGLDASLQFSVSTPVVRQNDDELSALKLEQVLALADAVRVSKSADQ